MLLDDVLRLCDLKPKRLLSFKIVVLLYYNVEIELLDQLILKILSLFSALRFLLSWV